jgi:hypothetical protein
MWIRLCSGLLAVCALSVGCRLARLAATLPNDRCLAAIPKVCSPGCAGPEEDSHARTGRGGSCQACSHRVPTNCHRLRAGALLARVAIDSGAGLIPFKRVQLQGGLVSLVSIEQLQARIEALGASSAQAQGRAADLAQQARAKMAVAGAVMADHWQAWPAQELNTAIREAIGLQQQLATLDASLSELQQHPHRGLSGVFERLRDNAELSTFQHQRQAMAQQLDAVCEQIAASAPPTTVPEADTVRTEAVNLLQQSKECEVGSKTTSDASGELADEVKRRQEADQKLGFDSLYTAARLATYGPEQIQTPLITKHGEQPYFAMPASLSRRTRRTRYEGGSQGFSFPIGHTGIRYRVGSFRGHPVQWEQLTKLDSGILVVTNQRLAFVGSLKSIAVPIAKVIHVEAYTDGLAVFHEGREDPDYFQCDRPQEFLLYLNWCLDRFSAA